MGGETIDLLASLGLANLHTLETTKEPCLKQERKDEHLRWSPDFHVFPLQTHMHTHTVNGQAHVTHLG